MRTNELTGEIIQAGIAVHRHFGPGLFESVYVHALQRELEAAGFRVDRELSVSVRYRGEVLAPAFRLDLLVERRVIVEVKSVVAISELHRKQVLTYLGVTRLHVGLVLNFNSARLIDGVARVVRRFDEKRDPAPRYQVFEGEEALA